MGTGGEADARPRYSSRAAPPVSTLGGLESRARCLLSACRADGAWGGTETDGYRRRQREYIVLHALRKETIRTHGCGPAILRIKRTHV